jgi:hypothetical protein
VTGALTRRGCLEQKHKGDVDKLAKQIDRPMRTTARMSAKERGLSREQGCSAKRPMQDRHSVQGFSEPLRASK